MFAGLALSMPGLHGSSDDCDSTESEDEAAESVDRGAGDQGSESEGAAEALGGGLDCMNAFFFVFCFFFHCFCASADYTGMIALVDTSGDETSDSLDRLKGVESFLFFSFLKFVLCAVDECMRDFMVCPKSRFCEAAVESASELRTAFGLFF